MKFICLSLVIFIIFSLANCEDQPLVKSAERNFPSKALSVNAAEALKKSLSSQLFGNPKFDSQAEKRIGKYNHPNQFKDDDDEERSFNQKGKQNYQHHTKVYNNDNDDDRFHNNQDNDDDHFHKNQDNDDSQDNQDNDDDRFHKSQDNDNQDKDDHKYGSNKEEWGYSQQKHKIHHEDNDNVVKGPDFLRFCTYTTATCEFSGLPSCVIANNGGCTILTNGDSVLVYAIGDAVTGFYYAANTVCSGNPTQVYNEDFDSCFQGASTGLPITNYYKFLSLRNIALA